MRLLVFISILFFSQTLLATNPIKIAAHAEKIVDEFYNLTGNFQREKPTVKISDEREMIAGYYRRSNQIVLETSAYEVCQKFGRDSLSALAFILGHELGHFYQDHEEHAGFSFLSYDHHHEHSNTADEENADVFGAMIAYLAGYKPEKLIPKLLDKLYDAYQLDEGKLASRYPSRAERKKASLKVQQKIRRLSKLFKAANYLMLLEEYEQANMMYKEVLNYYEGIEVLNNMGLLYLLQAKQFVNLDTDKYLHPIEIDIEFRLNKPIHTQEGRKYVEELSMADRLLREKVLKLSIRKFTEALQYNPYYFSAHLNKINAYNLLNEPQKAIDYYNEFAEQIEKSSQSDGERAKLQIALAISAALQIDDDRVEKAKEILTVVKASEIDLYDKIADYNLAILNRDAEQESKVFDASCFLPQQVVENMVSSRESISALSQNESFGLATESLEVSLGANYKGFLLSWSVSGKDYKLYVQERILGKKQELPDNLNRILQTPNGYFYSCANKQTACMVIDASLSEVAQLIQ